MVSPLFDWLGMYWIYKYNIRIGGEPINLERWTLDLNPITVTHTVYGIQSTNVKNCFAAVTNWKIRWTIQKPLKN
jgi:hypothetical protein